MNKFDLIKIAAGRANFTQPAMRQALEGIISTIIDYVSIGEEVKINGFGVFFREHRNPRTGRNPLNGEPIPIPPRDRPAFKPGKEFLDITEEMSRPRER